MATNRQLEVRIAALEAQANVDVSALEQRLAALETKACPQQAVLDAMEARLAVLDGDHVPTP